MLTLTFIGYGEAAQAFTSSWEKTAIAEERAFDIKTASACTDVQNSKKAEYDASGVKGCDTLTQALDGADVIFSLVTADQALIAAQSVCTHALNGALYFDCNSCSPQTKRASAALIEKAGGLYIDVAIMAPVHPSRHKVPLLVSGLRTDLALDVFQKLGMSATVCEGAVGAASSVKMMRSIMIKGMEALTVECLLAARSAGVEEQVLNSLQASDPAIDWRQRSTYMLERVMVHGLRRAAEMREVVTTVEELGISPDMASATVQWQQRVGDLKIPSGADNYPERLDAIIKNLKR